MSSSKKIVEFPDVEAKLLQPTKQSAFERQRAEAEAKRRREAAETAAVYEDFVKSFENDGSERGFSDARRAQARFGGGGDGGPPERPALGNQSSGGGAGRRHFSVPSKSGPKSGPGSLGPGPLSFGKKRTYDGFSSSSARDPDDGRLGFDEKEAASLSVSKVFNASDDEEEEEPRSTERDRDRAEEKAISKPTLRLANLPPNTSPAAIKALIPANLTVESVKLAPPSGPNGTEKKSGTAIVTLSKETPATEIDYVVSTLQNRYLGFGFYLSLHRHLSSAAISSSALAAVTSSGSASHPFGAKRISDTSNRGPQSTGHGRNYAPPSSYGSGAGVNRSSLFHVPIQPPKDIKKLRMIHKVLESVLEYGPDFEALLMSRPEVQREDKWAWIWDARSEGGIWYRWRLWEIFTNARPKLRQSRYFPLFERGHAWKVPDKELPYEYTLAVDGFVSDSEYNSDDDDEFEDEQNRQGDGPGNDQEDVFLNPIEKSKLAHLLARLPKTLSKIRKGDVARVTTFAITHASRGADEIVEMIVSNIERPLAYTSANPDHKPAGAREKDGQEGTASREDSLVPAVEDKAAAIVAAPGDAPDTSAASLLGLYVVSDILSSSSTSGIRHAWRYRHLFESALRTHKTFEMLGTMAEKLGWGRLRAEKWKRSIGLVLSLWEGWCVFPIESHEFFVQSFESPPALRKEVKEEDEVEAEKKSKWKPLEAAATQDVAKSTGFRPVTDAASGNQDGAGSLEEGDGSLEPGDGDGDMDPSSYVEYSDWDGSLPDEDLDGETLVDLETLKLSDGDGDGDGDVAMAGTESARQEREFKTVGGFQMSASRSAASRKRMRAVDMFAESGSEDGG